VPDLRIGFDLLFFAGLLAPDFFYVPLALDFWPDLDLDLDFVFLDFFA